MRAVRLERAGTVRDSRRIRSPRPTLLAGEDLPPPPAQARSTDNRRRLKAAALALFRDKGYGRTSIDDIVTRAKVPVGGFYLHFRSKRQLILTLMDDLLEVLSRITFTAREDARPRDTVRRFLRGAFARDLEFLGAYRGWQEAVSSEPGFARYDAAIRRWSQRRVRAVFARLQQLPGARRGVDLRVLACVMDRLYWTLLEEAARLTARDIDQRVRSAAEVTYHALFVDSTQEDA